LVGGPVEPFEQLVLGVGLAEVDLQARFPADRAAQRGEVVERPGAVDLRFPLAEAVQVGAVEHQDSHDVSLAYASRCCSAVTSSTSTASPRASRRTNRCVA